MTIKIPAAMDERLVFWTTITAVLVVHLVAETGFRVAFAEEGRRNFVGMYATALAMLGVASTLRLARSPGPAGVDALRAAAWAAFVVVAALAVVAADIYYFITLKLSTPLTWDLWVRNAPRLLQKSAGVIMIVWVWGALYLALTFALSARAQAERARRAEALADQASLQMLRYQLNPHFLFNTLTSLSALVADKRTDEADQLIDRLSAFLRRSLETDANALTPLAEELALERDYLAIEQVRFGERLRVEVDVAPAAQTALVPPLILQPLIENAVRHAVGPTPRPVTISVQAEADEGVLTLRVRDDGPGFPAERMGRRGVGLANVEQRLRTLYADEAALTLADAPGGGAQVIVTLPLEEDAQR